MDITLSLSFACCRCKMIITADLKCKGVGVSSPAEGQVATVNVPCPDTNCQQVNQLFFETTGVVRGVRPFVPAQGIPEPSVN
jgi:hypothetical protein